jgi:electron transfer flavoprotein alpha/beta subunit
VGKGLDNCILTFVKISEQDGKIDEQDLSTLEFSRRLKEKLDWKLIGGAIVRESFETQASREIFARGVDEAFIFSTNSNVGEGDIYSTASTMRSIVEDMGCMIVVFGERSSDTSFGCLGGYVAGMLGFSYVAYVSEVLGCEGSTLKANAILENEITLEAKLPAVLVPIGELFPPRPVLLRDRMEAKKKQAAFKKAGGFVKTIATLVRAGKPEQRTRGGTGDQESRRGIKSCDWMGW